MIVEFTVLAASALLAVVVSTISRWLALCATAAGGLTVAFFIMPPVYSLRVSKLSDIMTLLAFGTGGVVLTHVGSKRYYRRGSADNWEPSLVAGRLRHTSAATALQEAITAWNQKLDARGIQVHCGTLPFPQVAQPHEDVVRVFSDLIDATLANGASQAVWCHAVQLPSRQCFYWCVEKAQPARTAGIQLVTCPGRNVQPVQSGGWPDSVSATKSESEFEILFKVTFGPDAETLDVARAEPAI